MNGAKNRRENAIKSSVLFSPEICISMTVSVNDVAPVARFLSFDSVTQFDFQFFCFVFIFQLWEMVLCFFTLLRTPVKCLRRVGVSDFIAIHEKIHMSITRYTAHVWHET